VIVGDAGADTAVVVTVKVAVVEPLATVTLAGTVALLLLDDKLTTTPPDPAEPLSVTVPVELDPPITVAGESDTVVRFAAVMVRVAVFVVLPSAAEIVALVLDETADVVIVNVAVVAPAATVTEPGTVALVLLDERVTEVPPEADGPLSVTVPVEEEPPVTDVGDTETLDTLAGFKVSVADFTLTPWVP